ncbi:MAG TPA: hypothetical protein VGP43_06415 [Chitinophagaceae bacterium]|nr:hypothetical protein [Chitinophagaceae bacterium]
MMKFFTTLFFLLILCFSIVAQQKKPGKPIPGKKSYTKKLPVKSTAKKTSNLPAPSAYRNVEKPFTFNGQWKGGFLDNSMGFIGFGGERIDYVLELESNGAEVTGYSYTYFSDRGKRYYTICKLRGTINRATKEVVVTEYERTKYNTPPDMSNCFQTHKLKYVKENAEAETLQGTWVPAPNQNGNCGYGVTSLSRRIVKRDPVNDQKTYLSPAKINPPSKDIAREQQPTIKQTKPIVKEQNKKSVITPKPPVVKNNKPINNNQSPKKDTVKKEISVIKAPSKKVEPDVITNTKFEKRENTVLKTIPIKNETFTIDFYDNGEIDGDSISVFYNGKLVLSHKRLTDKPITITLTFDPGKTVNELVMYAENLGEIPPNTALMIIHDGDNRYEARITSDIKRNGTIRFSH